MRAITTYRTVSESLITSTDS